MDITATILLIGIVIIFTFYPLFSRKKSDVYSADIRSNESLEFDRQNILSQINELDFDHQMENISDDDYHQLKDELTNYLQKIEAGLNNENIESACPVCGAAVSDQDKFCGSCGASLN